jgi:hypothetical protein
MIIWLLIVFEFLSEHLPLFFQLAFSRSTTSAFIVSAFSTWGFPAFKLHSFDC